MHVTEQAFLPHDRGAHALAKKPLHKPQWHKVPRLRGGIMAAEMWTSISNPTSNKSIAFWQ
jgi:hypothetical protein